jgi:hypothetical protein
MTRVVRWSTPGLLALAVAAALAVPSLAAQPRAGDCWGSLCSSNGVSSAGFEAAGNVLYSMVIPESCLGGSGKSRNYLEGFPNIKIHASGAFSMPGPKTLTNENAAETMETSTTVTDLHGKFVTPTKATITLTIHYGNCGTKHVTVLGHPQ